jgi:AcrR family transcriptional regulator
MGRKRTITAEQILAAAESVVGRVGAAELTLDAVAEQAGVSKATILYTFNSKKQLIEAVVRNGVTRDTAFNNAAIAELGDTPSAVIRGRLLAAGEPFPAELHTAALNLCSALMQDDALREVVQATQADVIGRIRKTSTSPRGAMLAYLALEGLKLLEILDFHPWPKAERKQLLREIDWLVDAEPQVEGSAGKKRTAGRAKKV